MFLSSNFLKHTKNPQITAKNLNKKIGERIKKFSQVSQLNDPNKNTGEYDYYDLNDFNRDIITKLDFIHFITSQHLLTQFPY